MDTIGLATMLSLQFYVVLKALRVTIKLKGVSRKPYRIGWIVITSGFVLMLLRRGTGILLYFNFQATGVIAIFDQLNIPLLISLSLAIGMYFIDRETVSAARIKAQVEREIRKEVQSKLADIEC